MKSYKEGNMKKKSKKKLVKKVKQKKKSNNKTVEVRTFVPLSICDVPPYLPERPSEFSQHLHSLDVPMDPSLAQLVNGDGAFGICEDDFSKGDKIPEEHKKKKSYKFIAFLLFLAGLISSVMLFNQISN